MNKAAHTDELKRSGSKWPLFFAFVALIGVFLVLCSFKPTSTGYSIFSRTWGFDHILLYDRRMQVTCLVIALVLIFPYTNSLIIQTLRWTAEGVLRIVRNKSLLFVMVSLASFFIFWSFKVKYFFLGDFNLRMEQVMRKEFLATEYLTMKLLYYFAVFGQKLGYGPRFMFELYSCLAGGFFIFVTCLTADILGKNGTQKILFFLAQVASGLLLVFFGYIEIYATPVLFMATYVLFAVKYLQNKKGMFWVALILILAIASHLLCLAALPSLLVLWYFNNKKKVPTLATMSNKKTAFFISGIIVLALIIALASKSSFVLPLKAPSLIRGYMTFFSLKHFWEIINGQILGSGLFFVFSFYLALRLVGHKIKLPGQAYFLLSLTGSLLFVIVLANLHRGSGDWDIMGFNAISLNLAVALLITLAFQNQGNLPHYMLLSIIGLSALNAFLWVDVNHTDRSIRKIDNMLVNDPGTYYSARLPSLLELMILYKANKLWDEAERVAALACENSAKGDEKACVLYARSLNSFGKPDAAKVVFENILSRTKTNPEAYLSLIDYYNARGQKQLIDYYMNKLFDQFVLTPYPFLNYPDVNPKGYLEIFALVYQQAVEAQNTERAAKVQAVIQQLKTMQFRKI